jgi:hypothetical protein
MFRLGRIDRPHSIVWTRRDCSALPGATSSSVYPKLWEASGLSQTDLVDKLIAHAFAHHERRRGLSSDRGPPICA